MASSEINLKEMNDRLLSILKCPTCSDYIMPPVPICSKGHTFCETCSSKLSSCSTCKEEFTGRNYAIEEVAELVIYPCKYASAGCTAKLRVKDKVIHEQDCLLRRLPCLFTDCKLESNISDYLQHLNNTHLDHLVVGTDRVVRVSLRNGRKSECVFSAFQSFFLIKFTTTATMLEWKVICEGSMKEASKFYFTFSISDPKNPHNSFQFSCTPGSIESKETFGRQLAIPIDLIYTYRDVKREDSIPIKLNVHKIPEDI